MPLIVELEKLLQPLGWVPVAITHKSAEIGRVALPIHLFPENVKILDLSGLISVTWIVEDKRHIIRVTAVRSMEFARLSLLLRQSGFFPERVRAGAEHLIYLPEAFDPTNVQPAGSHSCKISWADENNYTREMWVEMIQG